MLYYLTTFPQPNTQAVQYEELAKLVKNTGHFTLHALHVNGRSGLYIEVANTITTMVEMRLLPTLTGIEGSLERRQTWVHRPEWALHALLTPTKEAQDLDVSVLHGASSACLTLRWTRSGVVGDLYASADDVTLLDAIAGRGWEARIPPKGIAGKIVLLAHRPVKTHLKPLIALFDPNQTAEKAAAPAAKTNEPSELVAPAASLADELLTRDGTGFLIGMGENGKPVGLHFRPQRLALSVGSQLEMALVLLIARSFGLGAGVVAIVPTNVAALLRRSGFQERLRFLDGSDPYQSASIPWRSLDPLTLDAALASTGIPTSNGQGHQAASFVDLLPSYLANDETRLLTAPPGDDLRGVVAAGGGVVLAEDLNNPHLAALLLHLMIADLGRPLVVIRPDYVVIPEALVPTAFDIVLGDAPSHTVLREQPDGWVLSDPDSRWSECLQRDLQAVSFSSNEDLQSALVAGLEGQEQRQTAAFTPVSIEPQAPLWEAPEVELEPEEVTHADEPAFELGPAASEAILTWGDLTKQIENEGEAGETADDEPEKDGDDELGQAPAWLKQAIDDADAREEPPTDSFGISDDESVSVGADFESAPELLPFEADQWSIDLDQDGEEPEETEEILQPRRAVSRARVMGRRRVGLKPRTISQQNTPVDEAISEGTNPTINSVAVAFVGADTEEEIPLLAPLAELVAPETEPEDAVSLVAPLAEQETEFELPFIELEEVEAESELVASVTEQIEPELEQPFVVSSKLPHVEMSTPTTNGIANGFVGGSTAHLNGQAVQPVASVATPSEIDLAPVAELIQTAREQGHSLPSVIAQIAPHYPQVAPAALRRAVRAMLDQPSAAPLPLVVHALQTPAFAAPIVREPSVSISDVLNLRTNGVAMPYVGVTVELEEFTSDDEAQPSEAIFFDEPDQPTEADNKPLTNGIAEPHVGVTSELEEATSEHAEQAASDQPEEPSFSTTEAARFLKVAPRTVQRWADDGKLASFRDEENNRRFVESELKRLKSEREAGR
jgi:excisionase family DNA binding protein